MQLGTEFKERSEWRYLETILGLFWMLMLPAVGAVIICFANWSQLESGEIACLVFAFIAIALLEFAAVKIFLMGLYGFYRHKKTAIIIYDDCIEIFFSEKRFKTVSRIVNYEDVRKFYAVSGWSSKTYTPKCSGSISFDIADEKKCFSVTIYDAKTAAELILEKLDFDQIDHSSNEIKKI